LSSQHPLPRFGSGDVDRQSDGEHALSRRFADGQRHLTPVIRALMRATGDEVDRAIDRALESVGTFCGADRSYVFRLMDDGAFVNNTHEWCRGGVSPQIDVLQGLPRSIVDLWLSSLMNDTVFVIDDVSEMPEGDPVRVMLENQDIRALVAVPMIDAEDLSGFVGFDIVRARDPFDIVEIGLLRNVGDAIGAALARRDAADAAREARLRALSAEEEVHRLASVTEVSTNLIVILDTEQRISWVNKAFEDQSGYRLEDILGRDFSHLVRGPNSDPTVDIAVRKAIEQRRSYEGETVNYDARGLPYWIQFNIHPMFDKAGAYVGYVSIETVITERKALEGEIESRNAYLSGIMRASVSAIVAMTAAGDVTYANVAAQHVLGLTPEPSGAGGYRWPDWIVQQIDGQPSRHGDLFAAIHHMDLSNAVSRRLALRLPDGTRRFLSLNSAPVATGWTGSISSCPQATSPSWRKPQSSCAGWPTRIP